MRNTVDDERIQITKTSKEDSFQDPRVEARDNLCQLEARNAYLQKHIEEK